MERDGKDWIMDGTLEQYGWARETWFQSLGDFAATRIDTSEAPYWGFITAEGKEETKQMAAVMEGGYWLLVQERITELFGELDWDGLRGLGTAERVERVKKQAEEKFAGANEETCTRYDRRHG